MIFLRDIKKEDIEILRNFRNSPEISQYMVDKTYITPEIQENWFKNISQRNDQIHKIFIFEEEISGLINFKKLDTQEPEWGFYSIKKGRGQFLMKLGLEFWDKSFPRRKLFAEVLKINQKSIYLHLKFGFKKLREEQEKIVFYYESI